MDSIAPILQLKKLSLSGNNLPNITQLPSDGAQFIPIQSEFKAYMLFYQFVPLLSMI